MSTPKEDDPPIKKVKPVSTRALLRFGSPGDKIRLFLGVLGASVQGAGLPAFSQLFGNVMDELGAPGVDFKGTVNKLCLQFVGLGVCMFVGSGLGHSMFTYTAQVLGGRIRCSVLQALLSKDVGWIDQNNPAALPSTVQQDVMKIEAALGTKSFMFVANLTTFLLGVSLGFYRGWQITLVMLACAPVMALTGVYMGIAAEKESNITRDSYGKAAAVAEEVLSAVRTVMAFGQERKEIQRYCGHLENVRKIQAKVGLQMAVALGGMMGTFFIMEGVTFWYGGELIYKGVINPYSGEVYTGGDILTVLFSVLMGVFGLGQVGPCWKSMLDGRMAAASLYEIIDGCREIEKPLTKVNVDMGSTKKSGTISPTVENRKGNFESIALENVSFWYPARPDVKVLDGVSLALKQGEKVAFVGESGSGKSTMVSLFERFYDPQEGKVLVNGRDIKSAFPDPRVGLRSLFGYVGQEPVMFAMSIRQNLLYGYTGDDIPSTSDIEAACRKANIWDFIQSLPNGLDTYAGASGASQISGGQKQRLAIARALLRKPQVLLLDEATSALDNESEKLVQKVLDGLSNEGGLTTVSIAHRLSTVRNCDRIFVMQRGRLVEEGSHDALMQSEGVYYSLVKTQEAGLIDEVHPHKSASFDRRRHSVKEASREDLEKILSGLSVEPEDDEAVEKKRIEEIAKTYKVPNSRLLEFNKGQLWLFIPGVFGALLYGSGMPAFAFLMAESMKGLYSDDPEVLHDEILKSSIMFIVAGFITFIGATLQLGSFSYLGSWFILRVRQRCFEKFMRQDSSFHDHPDHAPGKLNAALTTYSQKMSALTGSNLGVMVQAAASLFVGLALSFIASPKLTGVMLATIPLLGIAGAIEMAVYFGAEKSNAEATKQAQLLASESIQNIRTVRAAGAEQFTLEKYAKMLEKPLQKAAKNGVLSGMGFGFSQSVYFLVYALGFWYGAILIEDGDISFEKVMQAMMGIIMGAAGMGQATAFMGDIAEAKASAHDVFLLLDSTIKIDAVKAEEEAEKSGQVVATGAGVGTIEFKDIHFRYPQRPDVSILNGLSFSVNQGQRVALVGPSGGGKSTVMALLQRLYDPNLPGEEGVDEGKKAGSIFVDGKDLRDVNLAWWRQQMGVVGQEPCLFDVSLLDNIKYGKESATLAEVEAVSAKANMDFIIPEASTGQSNGVSWGERLGPRGSLLSGGQKQRTAIARALVRTPKVLLLDEATSALDSQSEKQVQAAIDAIAAEGRGGGDSQAPTMFVIAHRLSTVKDVDLIMVIAEGRLVEQGSHQELMDKGGVYRDLYLKGQK